MTSLAALPLSMTFNFILKLFSFVSKVSYAVSVTAAQNWPEFWTLLLLYQIFAWPKRCYYKSFDIKLNLVFTVFVFVNQTRSRQRQSQKLLTLVYGLGTSFDNVLLEHGELPSVLPLAVHRDLGHFPDTQVYLGLLPKPCTPTQTLKKWPIRF